MWVPKIKNMDEFDKAAWKGFIIGVCITVLTLAPFVLLALGFLIFGPSMAHHVEVELMP